MLERRKEVNFMINIDKQICKEKNKEFLRVYGE